MAEAKMAEPTKFDLRTHIVDPKSGKLVKYQPYRYVVEQGKAPYFVRDGKKYTPGGEFIGAEDESANRKR